MDIVDLRENDTVKEIEMTKEQENEIRKKLMEDIELKTLMKVHKLGEHLVDLCLDKALVDASYADPFYIGFVKNDINDLMYIMHLLACKYGFEHELDYEPIGSEEDYD